MSEELQSKYLKKGKITGQKIGDFEYFQIGASTFKQLKQAKLISNGYDNAFTSHKPDRLIVDRRGSKPLIIAVIEDKKSGKFNSKSEEIKAIQQCNNYCQELNAKMGIITDGKITVWINSHEKNKDTEYEDAATKKKRSYSLIKKEDGAEVIRNFNISEKQDLTDIEKMSDETRKTYKLIKEISQKVNNKNSIIKEPERIDPLPLARRVWQGIWVATGKTPEKCLYNVVELFIFKFLSDLNILNENFEELYKRIERGDSAERVLDYYVKNCRDEIHKKFKKGPDGTTIINGTIFVDEFGNANTSQASLFVDSIKEFKEFEKKDGKFSTHNIDKDFKTKLYENFLKQTAGLKALGQFFTPRKVVRSIVEMSGIADFTGGERFCDPFCGVGGFVLEPLNLENRKQDFKPKNKTINSPIVYRGYDKGFEKDEERTIILAKANMLIYLAEMVAESKLTEEFAENAFNKTFTLWRSNLGTLGEIKDSFQEETKFNLILTNPPYVKRGIKTLKNEIENSTELKNFYSTNGGGLEGLALEWIIRHLKKGGEAFVVIPDGILNRLDDKKLRSFILQECFLDAIVSLPQKTFYATPKKTYILAITKKEEREKKQDFPVYTYLVSDVGETLDINRFETPEKNNLPEMVDLFSEYQIYRNKEKVKELETKSSRCKIQPIKKFEPEEDWSIDRWWTKEEKIELGIEEEIEILSPSEFFDKLEEVYNYFGKIIKEKRDILKKKSNLINSNFKNVIVEDIFEIIGEGSHITKKYINDNKGKYPVYSGQTLNDGLYGKIKEYKYDCEMLTWVTYGDSGKTFARSGKFSIGRNACGLKLKSNFQGKINLNYIKFILEPLFIRDAKGEEKKGIRRLPQSLVKNIDFNIPINEKGEFDLDKQKEFVLLAKEINNLQKIILKIENDINSPELNFLEEFKHKEKKLSDLFDIKQGNAYYTKKHIMGSGWHGEIPVYSSNTKEDGLLMKMDLNKIKPEDLYYQYCLTWSVDGYAGTLFIRNKKNIKNEKKEEFYFTINNHCGLLLPRFENLYLSFIKWIVQPTFYKISKGYGNNKVGTNQIKDIFVKVPVDKDGNFDISRQKEIAQKYEKVEELKKELTKKLDMLANYKISLE